MNNKEEIVRQLLALLNSNETETAVAKPSTPVKKAVLVTTAHRGVFCGYAEDTSGETITLMEARMAVYWSKDMRGVLGLASKGPSESCRISPAVESMTLESITGVALVSDDAMARWKAEPWS